MEAQVVLYGVRGVEDGPIGSDDQDKTVESLQVKKKRKKKAHRQWAETLFLFVYKAWAYIMWKLFLFISALLVWII